MVIGMCAIVLATSYLLSPALRHAMYVKHDLKLNDFYFIVFLLLIPFLNSVLVLLYSAVHAVIAIEKYIKEKDREFEEKLNKKDK